MRKKSINFHMRCSPEWMEEMTAGAEDADMSIASYIQKAAHYGSAFINECKKSAEVRKEIKNAYSRSEI